MKLNDLCNVIQDTASIPIRILTDTNSYEEFCDTWKFHDEQKHLHPKTLKQMLQMLPPTKALFYRDCYRIHFTFLWVHEVCISIGPYCTELLSELDYHILVKQTHLCNLPAKDVLTYRSKFPITKETQIMHLIHCLDKYTSTDSIPRTSIYLDSFTYNNQDNEKDFVTYKPYSRLIQDRYKKEGELMQNIGTGKEMKHYKTGVNCMTQ